jgi:hypothetical protein
MFANANISEMKELRRRMAKAPEDKTRLQRTKSVGFRVRQQEYDELLTAAEAAGMPIGEWIREVALRAARSNGTASEDSAGLMRIGIEELAALKAVILTLFGTTHPGLGKEEIDQIVAYADSVKRERADALLQRKSAKAAVPD